MPGAHYQRGSLLFEQERYQQAIEEFQAELAEDPESPPAYAMLALCHSDLEQFKPATEFAQAAVTEAPDWDFAHYVLARVYFDRNRDQLALESIDEALRLDPEDPDYYSLKSAVLLQKQAWTEVLDWSEQGLALDPEHVGCQNLRAIALGRLGQSHERGESLESALAASPDNPTTHANQGWMLLESGQVEPALDSFGEALRLDPHNEWAREGILTGLKAKNPIYRGMLAYFFWMARLSPRTRTAVVIGALIGHNILRRVGRDQPHLAPYVLPVSLLYLTFLFLTWTAEPLFDLMLLFDRRGRRVLDRRERIAAGALGVVLLLALASLPVVQAGTFTGWLPVIGLAALAIPVSSAGQCERGWPLWIMGGVAAALTALCLFNLFVDYLLLFASPEEVRANGFFAISFLGSMLSTWFGGFLVGATVRK